MMNKFNFKYITENKIFALGLIMLFSFIATLFLFYKQSTVKQDSSEKKNLAKLSIMRLSIVGKQIYSLDSIAPNLNGKPKILLVYSGYDCSVCLKHSFAFIASLKNNNHITTLTIASDSNIGSDKILYDYDGEIVFDSKNELRKELNYILTPVFLHLDSNNVITSVYWALSSNNEDVNESEFEKFLTETYN